MNFQKNMQSLKPLCSSPSCKTSLELVKIALEDIEDLNNVIRKECQLRAVNISEINHRRNKREALWKPLNLLGNIAHKFTGLLDNDYGEKMEKAIEQIKSNEEKQMNLFKTQTTILDNTIKIIKKNNIKFEENFNNIKNEIQNSRDMLLQRNAFNTGLIILNLQIKKYREIQREIHRVLIQFKNGQLNPFLLNPSELNEQLIKIQNNIGSKYKLPSTNFVELEELVEVAVAFGNSCILFHIELPLLHDNELNLYKVIPVPNYQSNVFVFIKPFRQFLAVDIQSQSYYMLTNEDIKNCKQIQKTLICVEHHPIFHINQDNHCEVDLFLHEQTLNNFCDIRYSLSPQFWIELGKENRWIYSTKGQLPVKLICGNDISLYTLQNEGIIEIPSDCSLETKNFHINGKNITTSNFQIKSIPSILPSVNISKELQPIKTNNPVILKADNLDSVSANIEQLKRLEMQPLNNITSSFTEINAHQWVNYILFCLIVITILVTYLIKKKQKNTKKIIDNNTIYIQNKEQAVLDNIIASHQGSINNPTLPSAHNFDFNV